MEKGLTSLIVLLIITNVNAQIKKGYWMLGGSGTYQSNKSEAINNVTTTRLLRIEPSIGYFIFDKGCVGIKGLIDHQTSSNSNSSMSQTYYGVGPFARYYFLSVERSVNIFSEGYYEHYILDPGSNNSNAFGLRGGVVFFFNTAVGLELSTGYQVTNNVGVDQKLKTFSTNLGFQIHLTNKE
jgi:hypothetical protein